MKEQQYEIYRIGKGDSFYERRKMYIGRRGTFRLQNVYKAGYKAGEFTFNRLLSNKKSLLYFPVLCVTL